MCELQEKDVYLLDDPLAAVDIHVAKHLYSECIVGLLQDTTRILVTHHVHFLHAADFVIVVEGGQIRQIGHCLLKACSTVEYHLVAFILVENKPCDPWRDIQALFWLICQLNVFRRFTSKHAL